MKTETVIKRVKNEISEKKKRIRVLAFEYAETPSTNKRKEAQIFRKIQAEKEKKKQLNAMLVGLEKKKKTTATMTWKRDKTLVENVTDNLK